MMMVVTAARFLCNRKNIQPIQSDSQCKKESHPMGILDAYECFLFIFVSVNIVFVMQDHKNNKQK